MISDKADTPAATPQHHSPKPGSLDELICYFEGDYVPMKDAKVSIMTHAFMYGTATFEGIRGYWNEEQGRLYGLKLREHVERIRQSCRILFMEPVPSVDELTKLIVETVRRNGFREDCYIRPSFYKSTRAIGVRLHDLEHELYIVALPFGNYIDTANGVRLMTSSWRRNADEALPARGKIVGGYVNMAFQKTEAELNGFDEAVVLTAGGHVNESSAANIFVVRDGVAYTPSERYVLPGVSRAVAIELAAASGIRVVEGDIDLFDAYVADEAFVTSTSFCICPVRAINGNRMAEPAIPGPVTKRLMDAYVQHVGFDWVAQYLRHL